MIKRISLCCLLLTLFMKVQGQQVTITPERPQRGEEVTIVYHPEAAGAVIGKEEA